MTLTINYKTKAVREERVNYVHFEDGAIFFTCDKQVHPVIDTIVRIPLDKVETFDVTPD